MTPFKSSAELKACAKETLFGKYGTAVGANLLTGLITFFVDLILLFVTDTTTVAGTVIYYVIAFGISVVCGLFSSGNAYFYLKAACGQPLAVSDIFMGFRYFQDKALKIQLWISLLHYIAMIPFIVVSFLVTQNGGLAYTSSAPLFLAYTVTFLLFEIVSVILRLLYAQTYFLMHDFPQYTERQLLSISRQMMKGQKGRLFYLFVSFLPLFLLSLLSCGIALLWIVPYMNTTMAGFYLDLVRHTRSSC